LLPASKEETTNGLVTRNIEFSKWGKEWSINVYFRTPVVQKDRRIVERVLESFRFDGVPAGDPGWAIGEARKHLPPEADPEKFTREGGSSVYYCQAERDGRSVIVTFVKQLDGEPKNTWVFRVDEVGAVTPIGP